jgi:hypothetical protein
MKSMRLLSSAAALPLSILALGVLAQSVVEKPALKAGDKWEFQQSLKVVPGDETNPPWSRRIVEIQPNERMVVAAGNNQSLDFDTSWNRVEPKGSEFSVVTYKFPMKVGDEWSYSARAGDDGMLSRQGTYKVAASESITVPGGTFDCLRVEGKWEVNGRFVHHRGRETYWYCPAIKYIAKVDSQLNQEFRDRPSRSETRHSELTRFTPGQ